MKQIASLICLVVLVIAAWPLYTVNFIGVMAAALGWFLVGILIGENE